VSSASHTFESRPTWRHPRVLMVLCTVFLCGMAAGALMVRLTSVAAARPSISTWKQSTREMTLARFQKELNLTQEQAREMETILDDYVLYYQNLQGQIADIRLQGHERILRILDPQQKEKFESMMTELSSKAK
jgi:hypothetical protein